MVTARVGGRVRGNKFNASAVAPTVTPVNKTNGIRNELSGLGFDN